MLRNDTKEQEPMTCIECIRIRYCYITSSGGRLTNRAFKMSCLVSIITMTLTRAVMAAITEPTVLLKLMHNEICTPGRC